MFPQVAGRNVTILKSPIITTPPAAGNAVVIRTTGALPSVSSMSGNSVGLSSANLSTAASSVLPSISPSPMVRLLLPSFSIFKDETGPREISQNRQNHFEIPNCLYL